MNKPLAVIVEDDPLLGQIFSKTLESDFEIELITDGSAALAAIRACKPVLVLLDNNLPGISGARIYAQLRADASLAEIHVILCTADAQAAGMLRDDVDLALLKPVSPTQLRLLAARILAGEDQRHLQNPV